MSAEGGQARLLARGSLAQQGVQVAGLVAMLVVVTVLARRLPLDEFGAYGLFSSIGGYLIIVQNAAAASAVRSLAAAPDQGARDSAFSTAAALYAGAGVVAGLLLALVGLVLGPAIGLSAAIADDARLGAALLGVVTAVGWPLTVWRDALRAEGRFVSSAAAEFAAVLAWSGLMLALALGDAPLAVLIAASGAIPLAAGIACSLLALVSGTSFRFRRAAIGRDRARELGARAGYVTLSEAAAASVYALDRIVLGLFRSATTVGLFEGPIRAHNVLRALNSATGVTALPTAARYRETGDERRLEELVVRGCRYTVALAAPLAVTGMVLSTPLLELWLGEGFGRGGTALAILLSPWVVIGCSGLAVAVLVGVERARDVARYAGAVAATNLALALALTPGLGLEGVAIATAGSYALLFPYLLRLLTSATAADPGRLARAAFLPAVTLSAALAGLLIVLRAVVVDVDADAALVALTLAGPLAYWLAFYALVLNQDERRLTRGILSRGPARPRS